MTPTYKNVTREKVMNFAQSATLQRLWQAIGNIEIHLINMKASLHDLENEIQMIEETYEPGEEKDPADEKLIQTDTKTMKSIRASQKKAEMSKKIISAEMAARSCAR